MSNNQTSIRKIFSEMKNAQKGRREFRIQCPNKPQLILNEVIKDGLFGDMKELFYFETPDAQKEILSLGSSTKPSMDLIFSQVYPFSTQEKSTQWEEILAKTPLAPKVLITRDAEELYLEICDDNPTFLKELEKSKPIQDNHWQIDEDFSKDEKKRYFESFDKAMDKLSQGELEKVVLARRLRLKKSTDHAVDWRSLAENFLIKPGQSFRYLMKKDEKIFISLTPELLFELTEEDIATQAIAGTCSRGKDSQEDQELFEKLLNNPKEKNEHDIVRREVETGLKKLNLSPKWVESHRPLKLAHIQHISSKLKAEWSGQSLEDLITALHPTPAVGGYPKDKALEYIPEWEGFTRGAYAAPVIVNTAEKTYAIVGLRSGLWDGEKLELYAGSGLVQGSTAQNEWDETESKLKNFTAELK
jgi:menaquinone-specific isochorismate synthase